MELEIVKTDFDYIDRVVLDGKDFTCQPEANGHFAFPKVPPGTFRLVKLKSGDFRSKLPLPEVEIRAGETTTISLSICTVTAHLRWPVGLTPVRRLNTMGSVFQGTRLLRDLQEPAGETFTIEDVAAGSYTLRVEVVVEPGAVGDLIQGTSSFTIPADPPGGALDIGEILLQPAP